MCDINTLINIVGVIIIPLCAYWLARKADERETTRTLLEFYSHGDTKEQKEYRRKIYNAYYQVEIAGCL